MSCGGGGTESAKVTKRWHGGEVKNWPFFCWRHFLTSSTHDKIKKTNFELTMVVKLRPKFKLNTISIDDTGLIYNNLLKTKKKNDKGNIGEENFRIAIWEKIYFWDTVILKIPSVTVTKGNSLVYFPNNLCLEGNFISKIKFEIYLKKCKWNARTTPGGWGFCLG